LSAEERNDANEPEETPDAPEAPEAAEATPEQPAPAAEEPQEQPPAAEEPQEQAPAAEEPQEQAPAAEEPQEQAPAAEAAAEPEVEREELEEVEETPRVKPEIPGADLEVDIVREGDESFESRWSEEGEEEPVDEAEETEDLEPQPIADAAIDLGAGARYAATGKRKTAVARVILKPGDGTYTINGRTLEQHFPRFTLQRNIRQPLEAVGYESRMDVVARMHGGGVSAQAGALRHGISRALLEADPNLRSELKRRGFLTRDARVKERKKAGLKKARKRPQFSKR